jgi:hypothetical protein
LCRLLIGCSWALLRSTVRTEVSAFIGELYTAIRTEVDGLVGELYAAIRTEVGRFIGELRPALGAEPLFICCFYKIRVICWL